MYDSDLRPAGGRAIGEHKDRPESPAWSQRSGSDFLDKLRRAGVEPASVDTVFCTHLHIDHVGWNTQRADGRWAPTFPNARYLVGRTELADWLARRDAGTALAMHVRGSRDSVLPIMDAGLVDLVDDGHELARGLRLTLLPGHTMGQMGLRLDRPDGCAIFCGDTVHSPTQILQPGISSCDNPGRAAETRRFLLDEAAATGRLLVPPHFAGWRRAHVRESGTVSCRSSGMIRDKVVAAANGWRWAAAADCCRGAGPRPPMTDLQMSATGSSAA